MSDFEKIKEYIEKERAAGAFIFMPSPILSTEDSFYMPMVETVELREDEVYKSTGKYRIHYNGLLRLAAAAGFEWSAIDTCRTDGRTDRAYCSFRAVGGVRKADGKVYFHKAEDDIDMEVLEDEFEDTYSKKWEKVKNCNGNDAWKRDGHETKESFVKAMVRRDLIQKRKNKLKLVESGAKARVIRFVLGIQSQYSNKNQVIGMPFIMVSYTQNVNHPLVRKAMANVLPESMNMIYGGVKDTGQINMINHDEDVIDIPVSDREPEPVKDQDLGPDQKPDQGGGYTGQKPEATTKKFQPEKSNKDGNLVDFQNIPVNEQATVLKKMCDDCGQDYDHYNKQVKGGIMKASQQWRDDFFNFIKAEKEKK